MRDGAAPRTIWTFGHGARPETGLVALLHAHAIVSLVDVRRMPQSRRHPHFSREHLARVLPAAGVRYEHRPGLSGMRQPDGSPTNSGLREPAFRGYADYMQTAEFEAQFSALVALAGDQRTAIMCAEALPEHCHRSLIADALTARGIGVEHIVGAGGTLLHVLRRSAKVLDGRVTYPAFGAGCGPTPRSCSARPAAQRTESMADDRVASG
jgi:uncharacterized protein (DUF488 family)